MTLTDREREIMEHATGWRSKNRLYRNRFVTGPDTDDWGPIMGLCARGFMASRAPVLLLAEAGMSSFYVTERGLKELKP